jgi:hypothetical protein
MLLVSIIKVIKDQVGWWTDLNVFLLISEVIEEIRVYLHRYLLIQANWNINNSGNGKAKQYKR